jgi:hypothetical protein
LIGSEQDVGDGEFDEYWGWIKSIVSTYTIECSVRMRVLLDSVAGKSEEAKVASLEATATAGLVIGKVIDGKFDLTLRETYNKIIHATRVIPVWTTGMVGDVEFRYWSGDLDLSGTRGGKTWRMNLDIAPWARSIDRFIAKANHSEVTTNVGQDWY